MNVRFLDDGPLKVNDLQGAEGTWMSGFGERRTA
jgi:hypothetical protein